jgi:hypothetical protein
MAYKNPDDQKKYWKTYRRSPAAAKRKQERQTVRIQQIKAFVRDLKRLKGCATCGENDPRCLDFHHTGAKEIEVANATKRGWALPKVQQEIDKCIVLCSNCHRKLHGA